MKQVIQNYRSGDVSLKKVPVPACTPNAVIVRNHASLISIGTERSIIELGKQSLLGKARQRPDLVKRFIEKARNEGLLKTFQEAMGRLDSPTSLGYSCAGEVVEVGSAVHEFAVGDRVACVGAGYASHAEFIRVPPMLCVPLSSSISHEEGAFGMLGIIAMHGFRTAQLRSGETVAVVGLGLLGLLTAQILDAYGFRVIGYDPDPTKVDTAATLGIDDAYADVDLFRAAVENVTSGNGVDAVILTAASKTSEPVDLSVEVSRYAGRVVVVGVADIHPSRNEMWHKEVEIVVSKAGGAGSLDPVYETKGIDYPIGFVRWTQKRNLAEFFRLVERQRITLTAMISHRVSLDTVEPTYSDILAGRGGPYIGVIVKYPEIDRRIDATSRTIALRPSAAQKREQVAIGAIGAGLFANALLLPALTKTRGVYLHSLSTTTGANAEHSARKFGFTYATTDYHELLRNHDITANIIATPHSQHAKMVIEAIEAGKCVFVEKPLCIDENELLAIKARVEEHAPVLMVGYNRRFSHHANLARKVIADSNAPAVIVYRVNAGFVPTDHWVHSAEQGRSRIVGEMGHFIDMVQFLTGGLIDCVFAERVSGDNATVVNDDNIVVTMKITDGSVANLVYSASGNRRHSREMLEIHVGGRTVILDDYKTTHLYLKKGARRHATRNQDMGYARELQHFVDVCRGSAQPRYTFDEIYNSTLTTFKIEESLSKGEPIRL